MSIIESIKQKILQLDAGTFQNLCDSYLCKKGYSNMVSLGGEAGTCKTTYVMPDTYFYTSEGKYVFVEYTTHMKNLFIILKVILRSAEMYQKLVYLMIKFQKLYIDTHLLI